MKKLASLFILSFVCIFSGSTFVLSSPPFKSCHSPTIAELPNGDLLCSFFAGDSEGARHVGIWTALYSKGTWRTPQIVATDEKREPCWNPVLYLNNKELLLFYKVGPRPSKWSGVMKRSTDYGKTWSEPELLPAGIYGPIKNKPLRLSDDTLLCGSSVESYRRWGCYIEKTKDGGRTWERSAPINLPTDFYGMIQPALLKTNSALILLARTRAAGYIAQSTSEDHGQTWTEASLTKLPNPNSGIDAITLHDGRQLLIYNNSSDKRTPLTMAISTDGFNWKNIHNLETAEGEFSYPAVIQRENSEIIVAYTWNRVNIKVASFYPKDL